MSNYLGVGIHSNIVLLSESQINDKGSLVIALGTKVDASNMLAAFDGGGDIEQSAASLIQWPIKLTDWEGKAKTATQIGQELNNFKGMLVDILEVFMTSDKAAAAISAEVMFKGLGINAETQGTLPAKLLQEAFVTAVYTNIANAFLTAAQPFMDNTTFRVKLRRTSKAKHYAIIPPKGRFKEVWIEPMAVPETASAIKWSDYELKNGLNDGTKVEPEAGSAEEASRIESMFAAPSIPGVVPTSTPGAFTDAPTSTPPEGNPFNQ